MKFKAALLRKIGPLPAWVWLAGLAGALVLYRHFTGSDKSSSSPSTSSTDTGAGMAIDPGLGGGGSALDTPLTDLSPLPLTDPAFDSGPGDPVVWDPGPGDGGGGGDGGGYTTPPLPPAPAPVAIPSGQDARTVKAAAVAAGDPGSGVRTWGSLLNRNPFATQPVRPASTTGRKPPRAKPRAVAPASASQGRAGKSAHAVKVVQAPAPVRRTSAASSPARAERQEAAPAAPERPRSAPVVTIATPTKVGTDKHAGGR